MTLCSEGFPQLTPSTFIIQMLVWVWSPQNNKQSHWVLQQIENCKFPGKFPNEKKILGADSDLLPRPHPQTWPAQRQLLGCIIPGCSRQFHRSDALGNHLRKKHLLPIPKGQWAKSWISRVENHHYYNAAVQAQLRENSGV